MNKEKANEIIRRCYNISCFPPEDEMDNTITKSWADFFTLFHNPDFENLLRKEKDFLASTYSNIPDEGVSKKIYFFKNFVIIETFRI